MNIPQFLISPPLGGPTTPFPLGQGVGVGEPTFFWSEGAKFFYIFWPFFLLKKVCEFFFKKTGYFFIKKTCVSGAPFFMQGGQTHPQSGRGPDPPSSPSPCTPLLPPNCTLVQDQSPGSSEMNVMVGLSNFRQKSLNSSPPSPLWSSTPRTSTNWLRSTPCKRNVCVACCGVLFSSHICLQVKKSFQMPEAPYMATTSNGSLIFFPSQKFSHRGATF